jgi:cellulose synthase/poly-beta-1,6-N-acetylglucosamine synthase-like glycosyltransferase
LEIARERKLQELGNVLLSDFLSVVLVFCSATIALFGLSQAWLALRYRAAKAVVPSAAPTDLPSPLPSVLIQLPVYNEPLVVERLLRNIAKLDYPRQLLSIQLLDDSNDQTSAVAAKVISEIVAAGGPEIAHIRRQDRSGFKAGALAYGLGLDKSDFVAIFDADFLPRPSFIKDLLPAFADGKIGLVQTRWAHINRDYSIHTKLMAMAIDNHFSVEQGGRQSMGCFTNFNGTAGIWRRKTIDEAGGWSADCLTEDLDLSFRAQMAGWQFIFDETHDVPAELPVTMQAIRSQQTRWTKGAAETGKKNVVRLWASDQPLGTKLVGTFHLFNSSVFLPVLVVGLAAAALCFMGPMHAHWISLLVHGFMAVSVLSLVFTYWTSRRHGGFKWLNGSSFEILSSIATFIVLTMGFSLSNGLAALMGLMGRESAFVRTPKFNLSKVATEKHMPMESLLRDRKRAMMFGLECGLALLFATATVYGLMRGNVALVDITATYLVGFAAVVFLQTKEQFAPGHLA